MKKFFLFLFLIIANRNVSAQNFYLKIIGQNEFEDKSVDSIDYIKKHQNLKSIIDENNSFYEKLNKKGFLNAQFIENYKLNDSVFCYKYSLGKKINYARIYIGIKNHENIPETYRLKNDTLQLNYEEIDAFLNSTLMKLENNGFSMAKVKLSNIHYKDNNIIADLEATTGNRRQVNSIVINGYDKFPESHKRNITRLYRKKVFNQKNLNKLYDDFEKFRFVKQTKYPEILFTKDSTQVYVYLEKSKPNSFDGYLGFTNDEESKLILSGYLDLTLNNVLNSGERFSLYWKSDGQDQKTFNLGLELPYIFKSPIGLKIELNIFKQDSTFQNTRNNIELGYFFNYNTRLYLGYQSTESSDIQNTNTNTLSDFDNSFLTTAMEFIDLKNDDFLFPEKTNLNLKIGTGKRDSKLLNDHQFFGSLYLKHNFYLNSKNIITIKSQNFYLQSKNYIVNELSRFGGINSIRGFNENSLQANTFSSLLTEYRYVLTTNLYIHSILDYGFLKDYTTNSRAELLGFGFGFGLLSKNGLFNLIYANGSTNNQAVKLSNSIVHISFKANF
ncbi:hypothetical protein HKT18_09590 [Flavobacterium sp. IMCC34852]|uniref:Bacterial surface antigen (D15) domain-containing protein n=1 Tax=Flavobacterium rivulicola TaxID=2732161 RepID=A0A7Y3VZG8_9FLAO|nr:hypothetical protein [Flavobacterium sp. IMCC34852]NNT72466.1 hypothetical protein [Flavobacterium sp. IMCC34852]